TFFLGCYLTGWGYENKLLGIGQGDSKAQARAHAAKDALENSKDLIEDANAKKLEHDKKTREAKEKEANVQSNAPETNGNQESMKTKVDNEATTSMREIVSKMDAKNSKKGGDLEVAQNKGSAADEKASGSVKDLAKADFLKRLTSTLS
ncbi:hypothetical protein LTS18_001025, partial [Coniosporium uncinatum]